LDLKKRRGAVEVVIRYGLVCGCAGWCLRDVAGCGEWTEMVSGNGGVGEGSDGGVGLRSSRGADESWVGAQGKYFVEGFYCPVVKLSVV
jgi:hypothetical protein